MKTTAAAIVALALCLSFADAVRPKRSGQRIRRQTKQREKNYSGAVFKPSPDGTAFNYITANVNVPSTQYVPSESSPPAEQRAVAWVGFGAAATGGSNGIMQTGCGFINDGQDPQSTRCWYEFFPAPQVYFSGFSPAVGDTVQLELWRNSATSGTTKITDLTNGAAVSATFSAPSGSSADGSDAEWIVENPAAAATFVDFGQELFQGATVTASGGNTYNPGDGTYILLNEWKDGAQWTSSVLSGASTVEVDWVGPS